MGNEYLFDGFRPVPLHSFTTSHYFEHREAIKENKNNAQPANKAFARPAPACGVLRSETKVAEPKFWQNVWKHAEC